MFVDSSVVVAILAVESDGRDLTLRLQNSRNRVTSPLVIYESVLALVRIKETSIPDAMKVVLGFLKAAQIHIEAIGAEAHGLALEAHQTYGKGRHTAQLNMGDCFSYAMAKSLGVPLLYKGDDFSRTDLA